MSEIILPPAGTGPAYYVPRPDPLHNQPVTLEISEVDWGGVTCNGTVTVPGGHFHDVGLWQTTIYRPTDTIRIPATPTVVQDVGTGGIYADSESLPRYYVTTFADFTSPATLVKYDVRRFPVHLQVDIAMEDGSEPPPTLGLVLNDNSVKPDSLTIFLTSGQGFGTSHTVTPWSPSHPEISYNIDYKAGVFVQLIADASNKFLRWSTDSGYTNPNCGITGANWGATSIHGNGNTIRAKAIFRSNLAFVADNHQSATIELYPNPARDFIYCSWQGVARNITISDVLGNVRWNYEPALSATSATTPLSGLANGTYYYRIALGDGSAITKAVSIQ